MYPVNAIPRDRMSAVPDRFHAVENRTDLISFLTAGEKKTYTLACGICRKTRDGSGFKHKDWFGSVVRVRLRFATITFPISSTVRLPWPWSVRMRLGFFHSSLPRSPNPNSSPSPTNTISYPFVSSFVFNLPFYSFPRKSTPRNFSVSYLYSSSFFVRNSPCPNGMPLQINAFSVDIPRLLSSINYYLFFYGQKTYFFS